VRLLAGDQARVQAGQHRVQVGAGEPCGRPPVQDGGDLVAVAELGELALEEALLVHRLLVRTGGDDVRWRVDGERAAGTDHPGAEADRGQMALTDATHTEHISQLPLCHSALVGMRDHGRVAQRGALDGVLVREVRADEQPAGLGQLDPRGKAVTDAREVIGEDRPDVPVPAREHADRAIQRGAHRRLVQCHHPPDHGRGPRLVLGPLLSRHEQLGDDAARVRAQPQ
jgi:hypothetical protein